MSQLLTHKNQTLKLIEQAQKIACITSGDSAGDGLMAVLAAQHWLMKQGKEVRAIFPGTVPENFHFVNGTEDLEERFNPQQNMQISIAGAGDKPPFEVDEQGNVNITVPVSPEAITVSPKLETYDLILCFEVNRLVDLGEIYSEQIDFFQSTPLVNIAANGDNDFYAKINVVDPTRSSASEVLYDLIQTAQHSIDTDLATTLLTGIIVGSHSFTNAHTTASAFAAASTLQAAGAAQSDIIENLYKKKSLRTLKLWGQIFARLEFDQNHRICRSSLTKSDFSMVEATPAQIENVTRDILRFVDGSDLFVLCSEYDGQVLVQLRSDLEHIDWHAIIGDHDYKTVTGGVDFVSSQSLAETEEMIFAALCAYQVEHAGVNADIIFKHCHPADEVESMEKEEAKPVVAQAPTSIPFEAPMQSHESGDAWLKKNFPRN